MPITLPVLFFFNFFLFTITITITINLPSPPPSPDTITFIAFFFSRKPPFHHHHVSLSPPSSPFVSPPFLHHPSNGSRSSLPLSLRRPSSSVTGRMGGREKEGEEGEEGEGNASLTYERNFITVVRYFFFQARPCGGCNSEHLWKDDAIPQRSI